MDWIEFLGMEEERNGKQDYYLAQIAMEVNHSVRNKPKTKLKDFMLTFAKPKENVPIENRDFEKEMQEAKSIWAAKLGVFDQKKQKKIRAAGKKRKT